MVLWVVITCHLSKEPCVVMISADRSEAEEELRNECINYIIGELEDKYYEKTTDWQEAQCLARNEIDKMTLRGFI